VRLLANLSRFVIADITNPRSTPLELQAAVPDYMIPFVPILQNEEEPFAMFVDLQNKYDWVLQPVRAADAATACRECLSRLIGGEMSASPTYLLRALVCAALARRRAAVFRQISV
jgi:hypothetical protein